MVQSESCQPKRENACTNDGVSKYLITRDSYDRVADRFAEKHEDPTAIVPLLEPFIERLPTNGLVLDAGCGPGRDASILLRRGLRVIGVDFSSEMIRLAKSVLGLDARIGDLRDLDFLNDTFDGIWANASLHHLGQADMKPTLVELRRVLKPGGVIFVSVKRGQQERFTEEYLSCPRFFKKYWLSDIIKILDSVELSVYQTNSCIGGTTPSKWLFLYAIKPRDVQLHLDFGCRMCALVDRVAQGEFLHEQNRIPMCDQPLHVTRRFSVFPALGHLVEGYTIVVSREHEVCMGALTATEWNELEDVKVYIRKTTEPKFGPITFFEHGSVTDLVPSGSSVNHAHVHAIPISDSSWKQILGLSNLSPVSSVDFARDSFVKDRTYLLVERPNGVFYGFWPDQGLPSQYLRRLVSRAVGEDGRWNWRYYPFHERVTATLERLRKRNVSRSF